MFDNYLSSVLNCRLVYCLHT